MFKLLAAVPDHREYLEFIKDLDVKEGEPDMLVEVDRVGLLSFTLSLLAKATRAHSFSGRHSYRQHSGSWNEAGAHRNFGHVETMVQTAESWPEYDANSPLSQCSAYTRAPSDADSFVRPLGEGLGAKALGDGADE